MLRPQAHLFRAARPVRYNRNISMKSEAQLREQLETEGFSHTYVWQDRSNAHYSDHTHAMLTAHIILDGELELTTGGTTTVYKQGDRCDVPAGAVHSARMGPHGCRYLIGEK
jgi:quercetin dioxygenase-like cupin family protein